jgi:hypothetical protein
MYFYSRGHRIDSGQMSVDPFMNLENMPPVGLGGIALDLMRYTG